jgi:hypothetical protein
MLKKKSVVRFLFVVAIILNNIVLFGYINSTLVCNVINLVIFLFILFWSIDLIKEFVYFSLALYPVVSASGKGYIDLFFISLTPTEVFMLFYVVVSVIHDFKVKNSYLIKCLVIFWGIVTISVLLSSDITIRLGVYFLFLLHLLYSVNLISNVKNFVDEIKSALMSWPLVALILILTSDAFKAFLLVDVSNARLTASYIPFLLPLLYFFRSRFSFLFWFFLAYLFFILITSNSRSIVIASSFLFVFSYFFSGSINLSRVFYFLLIGFILLSGISSLRFMEFTLESESKSASNFVRITKIVNGWNTFKSNPVIGLGYGESVVDFNRLSNSRFSNWMEEGFYEAMSDVKASAEFGPVQILAELGVLGLSIILVMIFYLYFFYLRLSRINVFAKGEKYVLFAPLLGFMTDFIQSNILYSIVIWITIVFITFISFLSNVTHD